MSGSKLGLLDIWHTLENISKLHHFDLKNNQWIYTHTLKKNQNWITLIKKKSID